MFSHVTACFKIRPFIEILVSLDAIQTMYTYMHMYVPNGEGMLLITYSYQWQAPLYGTPFQQDKI